MGIGVIYSILYGESRSTGVSSFVPLTTVHLPPKVFGMADVCSSDKVMVVRNRILLYYKYDHRPADCVKIFRRQGKLGFRFLHLNLLNTTLLSPVPDSVRLYDGDMYGSISPAMIADITFESGDERRRFFQVSFWKKGKEVLAAIIQEIILIISLHFCLSQTRESALTVRLHASGGSEMLGFIAEVVSIPTASSSVRDRQHMFANGVCAKNIQGGLHYSNVGEVGPAVSVFHSLFKENGESLFGNFSTSSAAMYFDVQNTVKMYIMVRNTMF